MLKGFRTEKPSVKVTEGRFIAPGIALTSLHFPCHSINIRVDYILRFNDYINY